jgi:hypothetical protein
MGALWWSFNSVVCSFGGLWVVSIGLWWRVLIVLGGLMGLPIAVRKCRARYYL